VLREVCEANLRDWPETLSRADRAEMTTGLIDALIRLGALEDALGVGTAALEDFGGDVQQIKNRVARIKITKGEYDQALALLPATWDGVPGIEAQVLRAEALFRRDAYGDAIACCDRVLATLREDDPLTIPLIERRALALRALGRSGEAEASLGASIRV